MRRVHMYMYKKQSYDVTVLVNSCKNFTLYIHVVYSSKASLYMYMYDNLHR